MTHASLTRVRVPVAFSVLFIAVAGSATADESDSAAGGADVPAAVDSAVRTLEESGSFRPPASELAKSDWIMLKSGEWLKGDVKHMRDDHLEFESAKLGRLVIDFSDIAELHSPENNRYLFENQPEAIAGPAAMQGDSITIVADGRPQVHPRANLIVILAGEKRERNNWNFGLGFGLVGRSGNTDSLDISGNAYVKRETARTRWTTRYLGAFAELEGDANTNNHLVRSQFDWFLTPRLFLIPMRFDYFNDEFQNIDYRLTYATGVGYRAIERGSVTWNVVAAPGYQHTRFSTGDREGTFVMVLGTVFEADITKYMEFGLQYFVNLGVPDVKQTSHHAETGVSFDIWGPLDFDVNLIFDRQEDPRNDSSGDEPEKNDLRLVVGLGLDF